MVFRYKLRTLLMLLAGGPPLLAWMWLYRFPLALFLAWIVTASLLGAVLGRTLLWGIEGLLLAASSLIATFGRAMRRPKRSMPDDADFSLSRFAANVKARRKG